MFKVLTVSRLAGFRRWVHDAAQGLGFQGLGLRGLGSVVPKAHAGTQYLNPAWQATPAQSSGLSTSRTCPWDPLSPHLAHECMNPVEAVPRLPGAYVLV